MAWALKVVVAGLSVAVLMAVGGTASAAEGDPPSTADPAPTVERLDDLAGDFSAFGPCNYNGGHPTVALGSRGMAVSQVQCLLRHYHGHRQLTIDGVFGRGTHDSVRWFQGTKGLATDGIVGPKTWAKLYNQ
jgi:peptidoglycan hydrolase-like protein with peptidoglycan-binding domain